MQKGVQITTIIIIINNKLAFLLSTINITETFRNKYFRNYLICQMKSYFTTYFPLLPANWNTSRGEAETPKLDNFSV